MKHETRTALQQKGWSDGDIRKAEAILERSTIHDQKMSKLIFWSAMLVIIIGNIAVSFALIPFLGVFPPLVLYGTIGTLGLLIGFVYNFLIHDIAHLQRKHHIIAGILVPVVAVMNILLMLVISAQYLPPDVPHNPVITSGVFVIPFLIPYVVSRLTSKDAIPQ
jgi:hypothetical protein